MPINYEQHKVLIVIRDDLDVDELVSSLRIPYPRLLMHLRTLLADGYIERSGSRLLVTPAGHAALQAPLLGRTNRRLRDPLSDAKTPRLDPGAVHLPKVKLD